MTAETPFRKAQAPAGSRLKHKPMEIIRVTHSVQLPLDQLAALLSQLSGQKIAETDLEKQAAGLLARDDVLVAAAIQEEQIAGIAVGYLCAHIIPQYSPYLVIEPIVVSRAKRRQGIGRKLMQFMEGWAKKNFCRYITLASQTGRTGAHCFYSSLEYHRDAAFQKFL